eukprot:m.182290 g.182290  ORF g.182290 m.182290 type:complete len:140 (-) comp16883_c0_seq1:3058-3477(-)
MGKSADIKRRLEQQRQHRQDGADNEGTPTAVASSPQAAPSSGTHRTVSAPLSKLDYALYATIYITLQLLFNYLELGAAFFCVAGCVFMYIFTSEGQRRPGELSPYSVFNKDFQAIQGTFDAAKMEREMRYGMYANQAPA